MLEHAGHEVDIYVACCRELDNGLSLGTGILQHFEELDINGYLAVSGACWLTHDISLVQESRNVVKANLCPSHALNGLAGQLQSCSQGVCKIQKLFSAAGLVIEETLLSMAYFSENCICTFLVSWRRHGLRLMKI